MFSKIIERYKKTPIQVRASFWFLIAAFLGKGISFITTPIFTRLLSTSEYGHYNVFNSWLSILMPIITLNLYGGVYTQGMVKFEDERDEYSSSLQGLSFILVLGWMLIYLCFHNRINEIFSLSTTQMLSMLLMMWLTAAFSFWSVEQRVNNKYINLVWITVFVTLAKPILGIVLILNSEDKVTARILGILLVEIVAYFGCFVSQIKRGKKFFYKKYWLYALGFNIPLLPHYLSMHVLSGADRIMIERMTNASEAGIYSLAYSLSMIMTLFNTALMQTIEPWLYKQIKNRSIENMARVAYPAFLLVALVNLLLIAFAPEVVRVFAPIQYHDAIWVVPPVAMSVYFMFAYVFFGVFEFYFEKKKYIAVATTIGAVINILSNYIFIEIFGYLAAGYTTLVCYILFAVFHFCFMRKLCKEHFDGVQPYSSSFLLMLTIAFVVAGMVFLFSYNNLLLRYGIILVGLIIIIFRRQSLLNIVSLLLQIKKK